MKNPPSGVSLSFLEYAVSVANLWIPSNDFQHPMLGARSEVLDGLPLGFIPLASFSGRMVFRVMKSQAKEPENAEASTCKIIYELFKIVELFLP